MLYMYLCISYGVLERKVINPSESVEAVNSLLLISTKILCVIDISWVLFVESNKNHMLAMLEP